MFVVLLDSLEENLDELANSIINLTRLRLCIHVRRRSDDIIDFINMNIDGTSIDMFRSHLLDCASSIRKRPTAIILILSNSDFAFQHFRSERGRNASETDRFSSGMEVFQDFFHFLDDIHLCALNGKIGKIFRCAETAREHNCIKLLALQIRQSGNASTSNACRFSPAR
jgi:hypothetical protein